MKQKLLLTIALLCMVAQGAWAETVDLSTITKSYVAQDGDVLTGTFNTNILTRLNPVKISIADGASITLRDATILGIDEFIDNENGADVHFYEYAGITCLGDATITLEGTNCVRGFAKGYPGIRVPKNKTLVIQGDGSLYVDCNGDASAIGDGNCVSRSGNITIKSGTIVATGVGGPGIGAREEDNSCGIITIQGGNIRATGGNSAAGIGGDYLHSGGIIIIEGGTIEARGGEDGAGIGGGNGGHGGSITINGGTIKAYGGSEAAGIGGGEDGSGGDIRIYGGTIEAYGGEYAAGIGGGDGAWGGAIWITGGDITAYGGTDAAGIGGGESGDSGSIVINGGDVYAKGKGYGVGIGAGEDGDVNNTISINGGTVEAEGGLDIGRAIGGEDPEDYTPISIGDRMSITNVSGEELLPYHWRGYFLSSYRRLRFEPCKHAGATYSIVNNEKHQCICQWCGNFEEDHSFDNNNHCVCGYDGPFPSEITLDVSKDMQAMLSDMKDKTVDITFSGRQFTIDSEWNTLCLPFSMTAEQINNSPLNNSKIVELDTEKTTLSDGVLTIAYKTATAIEAGKPYMVKWVIGEETGDTHIDDPIFKNVTISASAPTAVSAAGISFSGAFAPLTLASGDKTKLWLDDDVRLRWASGQDEQVSPTWCYWNLGGLDASTLNAIVVTFDDGSRPIVELMDGMTDFSILSAFGEQEVNASLEGRELSAVQQDDGTWQSRAYTLCLPFYAELFDTDCDFTIYSKAEVTQDGELLFTQEMLPFLYPGNAYLIVVNEGTLRLQEEGVTIIAEADEADVDMNSVLLNNGNDQIAGYWLGSLKEISHDEAVSRKAFTLASDGSFQRITDEHPTWKWPAFRAMFCATDLMTADKLTTKYQLDANGKEEEDRSLPAPDSYQGDNDGEATAIAPVIHTIDLDGTERWFDLNGRQLSGKPTQKGVYIHRGKKQVVK